MEGPKDHQAAMAMGNTERAWTEFYDRHYQKRECQAGVEAMAAWRTSMLERPGPSSSSAIVLQDRDLPQAEGQVIALDD